MLSYAAGSLAATTASPIDSAAEYTNTMDGFFAGLNATIMTISDWEPIPLTDHILDRIAPPTAMDGSFLPLPDPVPVDPVVEVHTTCKVEPTDDPGTNPNSFYRAMTESLVQTGGASLRNTMNPFRTGSSYGSRKILVMNDFKDNPSSVSGTEVEVDSRETYNLGNTSNAVTWMAQDPEIIKSVLTANGKSTSVQSIENALMTLPNQIKSLFLASSNPNVVTKKWFSRGYDFVRDLRGSSAFRLNYQLIKRVDVLVGYKRSNSKRMIKEPIWEPLTQSHYQNSIGEGLLCRLQTYTNVKMGIVQPKGLVMPTYDEYFILRPPRQESLAVASDGSGVVDNFGAASGIVTETATDSFDVGVEGAVTIYENSVDVAPVEATNSNFYDCGEVA